VQDALWRVIYDNDYHPRRLTRTDRPWRQPWTVRDGSGWRLDDDGGASNTPGAAARVFTFDNKDSGGTIFFDRDANPANNAFSDWLAYDVEDEGRRWTAAVVGDLKVQFDYARSAGDGPLRLRLTKDGDTFTAELSPTTAKLFRKSGNGGETELDSAPVSLGARASRIEFENVDHRVTLRVNGHVVIQTTPEQYAPNTSALLAQYRAMKNAPLPAVEIAAERQTSAVSHLSLWRDVYYLNRDKRHMSSTPAWASPTDFPENVITLGPDEYFVLGDNSLMSLDARMWNEDIELPDLQVQAGRVPDRFMLGKAFFVYWPAGYKPLAVESMPALTPNFGDMRFIR
jgi:signal peptidase I